MVLGMRTPHLLPRTKFTLPSGLMVAETELMDVFGSRLVFGGTAQQITEANILAGVHYASVEGQTFYRTEYLVFRDTVNGNINLKDWDSEAETSPFIIEEDDNEEKCILEDCQECKIREEHREATDIALSFTNELRSQPRDHTEYQVFYTQRSEDKETNNYVKCNENTCFLEMGEYFGFGFETKSKAGFGLGFVSESKAGLTAAYYKLMGCHSS